MDPVGPLVDCEVRHDGLVKCSVEENPPSSVRRRPCLGRGHSQNTGRGRGSREDGGVHGSLYRPGSNGDPSPYGETCGYPAPSTSNGVPGSQSPLKLGPGEGLHPGEHVKLAWVRTLNGGSSNWVTVDIEPDEAD